MNIKITKHYLKGRKSPYYRADCEDLCGSPPVGSGRTKVEAVAHLMCLLTFPSNENFVKMVKRDNIFINGKQWFDPLPYTR